MQKNWKINLIRKLLNNEYNQIYAKGYKTGVADATDIFVNEKYGRRATYRNRADGVCEIVRFAK